MPRLKHLKASEIAAALERVGFALARQSGSHKIYKNAAGRRAAWTGASGPPLLARLAQAQPILSALGQRSVFPLYKERRLGNQ